MAALRRPYLRVAVEELEKREKSGYKGRALRRRMKLLQEHLDGRMRLVRYEGLTWAFSEVCRLMHEQNQAFRERMAVASQLITNMRMMLASLPAPSSTSPDMHVVAAVEDERALDRLRRELAGNLRSLNPFD